MLIVDDDKDFLGFIYDLLCMVALDWEITCAENGVEAADKIIENNYHLILSDYHMPGKTGLELFSFSKQNGFNGKFYLMSGVLTEGHLLQEMELDGFLAKPFPKDKLIELLEKNEPG